MKSTRFILRFRHKSLAALLLLLAGCQIIPPPQPDHTRYYVLTGAEQEPPAGAMRQSGLRIGLAAVQLPDYLDRNSIMVRKGDHELVYNDFARWGEPLATGIARLVRLDLLADDRVAGVTVAPFAPDAARDYDVSLRVIHCEGIKHDLNDRVRFAAEFTISTTGPDARVLVQSVFVAPDTKWNGRNYAELAASLSRDVSELSRAIAAALPAKR